MKTKSYAMSGLAALVAGLLMAFSTSVQSGPHKGKDYKFGGAWIGTGAGMTWTSVQTPLEPSGRSCAARVITAGYGPDLAALFAAFDADGTSDGVAEARMISKDTGVFSLVAYMQKHGNPIEIKAIEVYTATWTFTSEVTATLNMTFEVYLPSADADGDGYPDPGSVPVVTIPGLVHTGRRVSVP